VAAPATPPPAATRASSSQQAAAQKAARSSGGGNTGTRIIVILVGLVLIFFGLRAPLALLAGTSDTAVVLDVDQSYDSEEEEYSNTVTYQFTPSEGKYVQGSFSVSGYAPSGLPSKGELIRIKYLAVAPFINTAVDHGPNPLPSLLLAAGGVALIWFNKRFRGSRD
jgi:hypothetical protein